MVEVTGTVFLVDDQLDHRNRLKGFLEAFGGLQIHTFDSMESCLESYDPSCIGCIVTELELPGGSGLELLGRFRDQGHDPPVIFLTCRADVTAAVSAVQSGAFSFLEKSDRFNGQAILGAITAALQEDRLRHRVRMLRSKIEERKARLTRREREVMRLMVEGKASKEIAADLDLSPRTVESHRAKVMHKMEASSLPDLVRFVVLNRCTSIAEYRQLIPSLLAMNGDRERQPAGVGGTPAMS